MHPLDGPRLKIRRANDEIDSFREAEIAFFEKASYTVVPAEVNPKTGQQVYRVRANMKPPLEWGVRIGEIAHNLRSALDGLVYQLALLEEEAPRGTEFPIYLIGRTERRRRTGGGKIPHFERDGLRKLRPLRDEHKAAIERLQPYKRGRAGRGNFLYLLHEISNADKHRLIQVVGPRFKRLSFTMRVGDTAVGLPPLNPRLQVLEDGARVMEAGPHVTVEPEIVSQITFWKGCAAIRLLPVHVTLVGIAQNVSDIVESFAPEFS